MDVIGISIYLFIAIICFVLMFMVVFLGDFVDFDFDADVDMDYGSFGGAGVSPMSLPVLLSFGVGFGAFGALFESWDIMDARFIPVIAGFFGIGFAGVVFIFFAKVLIGGEASQVVTKADLMGKVARVSIPLDPGELGQVVVNTEARGRTQMDAVANESIPVDASVKIISVEGTTVRVEKFEE